jgi:hypothetical protein
MAYSISTSQNSEEQTVRYGSCLCGAVQYEVIGDPYNILICHCESCQKATGSAFMANSWYKEDVSLLAPLLLLYILLQRSYRPDKNPIRANYFYCRSGSSEVKETCEPMRTRTRSPATVSIVLFVAIAARHSSSRPHDSKRLYLLRVGLSMVGKICVLRRKYFVNVGVFGFQRLTARRDTTSSSFLGREGLGGGGWGRLILHSTGSPARHCWKPRSKSVSFLLIPAS